MIVAFDIETDTSGGHGLDPTKGGIVSIAAVTDEGDEFYECVGADTSEKRLLNHFDEWMLGVPEFEHYGSGRWRRSRFVTWNGAVFDIPFMVTRATIAGASMPGLCTVHDPAIVPKYDPLPGWGGGVKAMWYGVEHVDIAYELRGWCEANNVRWSLKPCARAHGIDVIEVDREAIHDLTPYELRAYNLSDARATLALAQQTLNRSTAG